MVLSVTLYFMLSAIVGYIYIYIYGKSNEKSANICAKLGSRTYNFCIGIFAFIDQSALTCPF